MNNQDQPTTIPDSLQKQVSQPVSTASQQPPAQTTQAPPEPKIEEVPDDIEGPPEKTVADATKEGTFKAPKAKTPQYISDAPPPKPVDPALLQQLQQYNVPEVLQLANKLSTVAIPDDLKQKAEDQLSRIALTLKYGGSLTQLDITAKYIDWITSLPWYSSTQDVLDINEVKAALDSSHYGLEVLKKKILEFLSIISLQQKNFHDMHYHVQSPMFVGLAGTGKTTFAQAIADALNRKFVRIPFGGLSSARDLRGQSKTSPESEPGLVMRALRDAGARNPVILLDELDRVSPDARAEVMGVLLELLDPGQNSHFTDNFIDYPFNLSEVLFVATGNNTTNVAAAVLDRLEVVQMPSYTDEEKMAIGKNYILPKMIKDTGLKPEQLTIDDALWPKMVRPLGFEPGIRSLERMVQNIVRRVAFKIVSGEGDTYHIDENNVKDYTNIIVGAQ